MQTTTNAPPLAATPCVAASTTPAPAPKAGLRKVSFGNAAKKEESTKTIYPVFTHPNPETVTEIQRIAARIKSRQEELDSLEGAIKTDKAELKMRVAPFYFAVNALKSAPPSSVSIPSEAGEVLVTFQNRYGKLEDENTLAPALTAEQIGRFFRQSFSLTIKGEGLPVGREQDIVDAVNGVLEKFNALDALEVKEEIKPTPDFHVQRLTLLTPEQNMALEQIYPVVAMVKTKGRGAK